MSGRVAISIIGATIIGIVIAEIRSINRLDDEQERNALISAVDDSWLKALHVGADPKRWPAVRFEAIGEDLALTKCSGERPAIVFNSELLKKYRWYYHRLTVPHEMAHVLGCSDSRGLAPHGPEWEVLVKLIADREIADEVIAEQLAAEEADSEGHK
jgi:hypothetical protein